MPVVVDNTESSFLNQMTPLSTRQHVHVSEAEDPFEALDCLLDCLQEDGPFIGSYTLKGPFQRRRGGAPLLPLTSGMSLSHAKLAGVHRACGM